MKKNIVIGIVSKHYNTDALRTDTVIRDEIKDALIQNGALPIGLLPPSKGIFLVDFTFNLEDIDKLLSREDKKIIENSISVCDGIVLQGGIKSDLYECYVAKYCFENDIPLLAICAGQNNMVRGLGGNNRLVENPEEHFAPRSEYVHPIAIDKSSDFYKIVKSEILMVNSRHKNVIDMHPGLDAVAYDEDGNIEVVENKSKRFYIGMRFHPESLCEKDEQHNAIFKAFVKECSKDYSFEKNMQ